MLHCAAVATRWCSLYPYQLLQDLFALKSSIIPEFLAQSAGQCSLETHPFQCPLQCLIPLQFCLKPTKCLLFQHVRWHKSWEMNKFHHSEEATWSRDAGQAMGASAACRSPWLCPGSSLCGHAVTGRKSHAALYTCSWAHGGTTVKKRRDKGVCGNLSVLLPVSLST